jgi:ABC-2 type transport system ATP-binding protein
VHALQVHGATVRFDVDTVHLASAVRSLSDAGIRTLVSNPPTLEELFLRHYGDELAEDLRHDEPAAG